MEHQLKNGTNLEAGYIEHFTHPENEELCLQWCQPFRWEAQIWGFHPLWGSNMQYIVSFWQKKLFCYNLSVINIWNTLSLKACQRICSGMFVMNLRRTSADGCYFVQAMILWKMCPFELHALTCMLMYDVFLHLIVITPLHRLPWDPCGKYRFSLLSWQSWDQWVSSRGTDNFNQDWWL